MGGDNILTKETKKNRDAFEIYYCMGDTRSLERVAKILGMAMRTMEIWSRSFSWQNRVKERDEFLTAAMQHELNGQLTQTRLQTIQVLRKALEKTMQMHPDGVTVKGSNIVAVDVNDLEKLIKAYSLVTGGATERKDHIIGGVLRVPAPLTPDQWENKEPLAISAPETK